MAGSALISNVESGDLDAGLLSAAGNQDNKPENAGEGVSGKVSGNGSESVSGKGTDQVAGDGSGNASEQAAEAASEKNAAPALNSDRAYVTMLTADSGGYEVFRASDLLTKSGESLLSENRKMEVLAANGIRQNAVNLEEMKVTAELNKTGLILVGAAAACMIVLLAILYEKKRRMNQME